MSPERSGETLTRFPLTVVPLLLPRSETCQVLGAVRSMAAWTLDTEGSKIEMPSALRPSTVGESRSLIRPQQSTSPASVLAGPLSQTTCSAHNGVEPHRRDAHCPH